MYFDFGLLMKLIIFMLPVFGVLIASLLHLRKRYSDIKDNRVEYSYKVNSASLKLAIYFSVFLLGLSILLDALFFFKMKDIDVLENIKLCTVILLSPLLPGGFFLSYIRKLKVVTNDYLKAKEELE